MILALTILALCTTILLSLVTLTQMLYMDSVRLRPKEAPMLLVFREHLEEKIGLKAEYGVLAYSLIKHSLISILGAFIFAIVTLGDIATLAEFGEAVAIAWLLMIFSAYVLPQFLYRHTSGGWLVSMAPVLRGLSILVRPLTALLGFLQSLAQLGKESEETAVEPSAQENIEALITAGTEEGLFEEEDRKLIESVVAFGNKTVREVMTPRPSIVSVSTEASVQDLRKIVIHEQFSRIPVFESNIDQIVGFVHVRDMFELDSSDDAQRTVRELARPIRHVPETKPVNDLMREMQADGAHMAIVVDEYGNTAGLVTMEDMVEEIVGEIRDEHEPAHDVHPDNAGGYIVSGSFDLDHLNEMLGVRAPEEIESTTVGGLVTEWMGRVPDPGEVIERSGIRIQVLAANTLRVDQVRISKAEHADA